MIPIHKKGERNDSENYRGITLLCCGYEQWTKLMARKIDAHVDPRMLENQNGFRNKGRPCIDRVFTGKLLMEKRREHNLKTHICFVDLE